MASYISTIPVWVIVLFIASFLYSIVLIANPAKQAAINAGITLDKTQEISNSALWVFILFTSLMFQYLL